MYNSQGFTVSLIDLTHLSRLWSHMYMQSGPIPAGILKVLPELISWISILLTCYSTYTTVRTCKTSNSHDLLNHMHVSQII